VVGVTEATYDECTCLPVRRDHLSLLAQFRLPNAATAACSLFHDSLKSLCLKGDMVVCRCQNFQTPLYYPAWQKRFRVSFSRDVFMILLQIPVSAAVSGKLEPWSQMVSLLRRADGNLGTTWGRQEEKPNVVGVASSKLRDCYQRML
jgi:hypothetical protein